jgi:hypothetical protein
METSATRKYLLWDRQQQQDAVRRRLESRQAAKRFVLVFSLVAFTVAVAAMFPR